MNIHKDRKVKLAQVLLCLEDVLHQGTVSYYLPPPSPIH